MTDLIKLAQEYKALNLPNCPELRREMLVKKFNSNDDRSYQNVAVNNKRGSGRDKQKRSQNITWETITQ